MHLTLRDSIFRASPAGQAGSLFDILLSVLNFAATMDAMLITLGIIALLIFLFIRLLKPQNRVVGALIPLPENYRQLLETNVQFYKKLDEAGKKQFENRVQHFLSGIRITGVGAVVEDRPGIDRGQRGYSDLCFS